MLTGRAMERTVHISPPEQLPERRASPIAPPVPVSWAGSVMEPPLFERAQLERMRQARRDHPLIYGQASEVGSDNSSRLQAEVQRQLEEYAARYQDQVRSLQDEVQRLRENRELAREQGTMVVGQPPGKLVIYLEYNLAIYLNTRAYLEGKLVIYLEYKLAIYLNTRAFLEGKLGKLVIYLEYKLAIYLNTRVSCLVKQAIFHKSLVHMKNMVRHP
eukprot:s5663_g2.t1